MIFTRGVLNMAISAHAFRPQQGSLLKKTELPITDAMQKSGGHTAEDLALFRRMENFCLTEGSSTICHFEHDIIVRFKPHTSIK